MGEMALAPSDDPNVHSLERSDAFKKSHMSQLSNIVLHFTRNAVFSNVRLVLFTLASAICMHSIAAYYREAPPRRVTQHLEGNQTTFCPLSLSAAVTATEEKKNSFHSFRGFFTRAKLQVEVNAKSSRSAEKESSRTYSGRLSGDGPALRLPPGPTVVRTDVGASENGHLTLSSDVAGLYLLARRT